MCDTFIISPNLTKNGKMIFAKNSDRSPNEPHVFSHIARSKHNCDELVQCTYISIPQVKETNEVTLFKPSWIWGAEMGYNEHNLFIGNEAVFTNIKYGKTNDGLIGMDLLRLALERASSPLDAIEVIVTLIDKYTQNGNCSFDHNFYYHNSFLIANGKEAYHLETAGKFYAYKKVTGVYAISNMLSIGKDFDFVSPESLEYAIKNKKAKSYNDFSFCECFSDKLFTHFSGAKIRNQLILDHLKKSGGFITIKTAMEALRLHDFDDKANKCVASVSSPCMHFGGLVGDHTTGSVVAEISDNYNVVFATLASTPCVSIFKPILNEDVPPQNDEFYWTIREYLSRSFFAKGGKKTEFLKKRNEFENKYLNYVKYGDMENKLVRKAITIEAFNEEFNLVKESLKDLPEDLSFNGNLLYNKKWKEKTNVLLKKK